METFTPRMLGKAIATNSRASFQDGLLLVCVMLAALLLALQYDLFYFIDSLSAPQRKISLGEALLLSALLAACLTVFTLRRMREQTRDMAIKAAAEVELRELAELAMRDPLTGLLNRRAFLSALDAATASPPDSGSKDALFLIDLNHFKRINDCHGHGTGDEILKAIAGRFQAAARPSDLVARIGGDEFAVLAYDVDEEAARQIAERFLGTLTGKIRGGGSVHEVSMAIGVALLPDNGRSAEEALENADLAMYRAKQSGAALAFYGPDTPQKRIA